MTTRVINVRRVSLISSKPFDSVIAALEAALRRPNLGEFMKHIAQSKSFGEMRQMIESAVGKFGLMEFIRFDLGAVLAKAGGPGAPRSVRFLAGNPLVMESMVKHTPDAGSYAPVTLLIDERPDGVHLSYDEMASFLEPYGNAEALQVARALDAKVKGLLSEVAN